MVAYSFNTAFVADIEARRKRQTIRLPRKRHARPGERVQLFQGMRTRQCRKIIPDPVCIGLDDVRFDLRRASAIPVELAATVTFEVNGIPLIGAAADDYARGDGFRGLPPAEWPVPAAGLAPFNHMALWWASIHGPVLFEGVAIRWEDQP
jgi:hypothetical protein